MSSAPCPGQIASLHQLYASLRAAVDDATEALRLLEAMRPGEEVPLEPFLAAEHKVSALAREISAMLDR